MPLDATVGDNSQNRDNKRFLGGVALAAVSSIPFLTLMWTVFRGMSSTKATGLAAVAGGVAELYVTSGLIITFMLPIAAIVLLGISFPGGNQTRRLFVLLSIGWSAVILLLYSAAAWLYFGQL